MITVLHDEHTKLATERSTLRTVLASLAMLSFKKVLLVTLKFQSRKFSKIWLKYGKKLSKRFSYVLQEPGKIESGKMFGVIRNEAKREKEKCWTSWELSQ